jgi:hypothetical protein
MTRIILAAVLALVAGAPALADVRSGGGPGDPSRKQAPAEASAAFINRVWVVGESKQVAPGDLRVFLSDGTLVMALQSRHSVAGATSTAA